MAKKEKIQEMFDSIAPEYDAFNHLTSLGADRIWRRRALREITGPRVLDEACGTGDFSIAIAEHLAASDSGNCRRRSQPFAPLPPRSGPAQKTSANGSSSVGKTGAFCRRKGAKRTSGLQNGGDLPTKQSWSVTGVDISEGMLEVMRQKVAALEWGDPVGAGRTEYPAGSITAEAGDCCALRFPDSSFDTVTVAFGVRNFEDREKALAEVLRVLRPGGRFVMLELGIPRNRLVAWGFKFYFTRIMPLIGGRMSGNKQAYRYLPASVLAFPEPKEWTAVMQRAGFREVRHRSLSLGICNLFTGEK